MDPERDNPVEALVADAAAAPQPLARQLADALRGAVFPLERGLLVEVARENEAPSMLLSMLGGLPNRPFASEDEVAAALESTGTTP